MKRASSIGLVIVISALVVFSSNSVAVYDGHGNIGDETNSLTLAVNAVRHGVPSYGIDERGGPWTLGEFTLPVYYAIYGLPVAVADPARRIDAGRHVSKVLVLLALALTLWVLLFSSRRGPPSRSQVLTGAVSAGAVAYLFALNQSFVFVANFARVDAVGLLSVVLAVCAFSMFRDSPGAVTMFLYAISVLFAYFANNFAFVCVSVLFVLTVPLYVGRANYKQVAIGITCALAVSIAADYVLNHVWLDSTRSDSLQYNDAGGLAGDRLDSLVSYGLWQRIDLAFQSFPEFGAAVVALGLCGLFAAGDAVVRARGGARIDRTTVEWVVATVVVPCGVAFVLLPVLSSTRFSYIPMMLLAVLLPALVLACSARRHWTAPAAGLLTVLVVIAVGPNVWAGQAPAAYLTASDRGKAQFVASPRGLHLNHRSAEWRGANGLRQAHIRDLVRGLQRLGIHTAIATDPLFALLDEPNRRFLFVNDPIVAGPAEEWTHLRRLVSRAGASVLVTNRFGDASFLGHFATPLLKSRLAVRGDNPTVEVGYPQGKLTARLLFVTQVSERQPWPYNYGGSASTPFEVFKLTMFPNDHSTVDYNVPKLPPPGELVGSAEFSSGLPPGWTVSGNAKVTPDDKGIRVRIGKRGLVASPGVPVTPGTYVVVARGTIPDGGIFISAADASSPNILAQQVYWSDETRAGPIDLGVKVRLATRGLMRFAVTNWSQGDDPSTALLEDVRIYRVGR